MCEKKKKVVVEEEGDETKKGGRGRDEVKRKEVRMEKNEEEVKEVKIKCKIKEWK